MFADNALQSVENARLLVYDGRGDAARSILQRVRAHDNIHRLPVLVAELQLAEGLLFLLDGDWSLATDRFRRSEVLGRVAGSADVIGHARAMLAHCCFNRGELRKSAEFVIATAGLVGQGRVEFRHRFCLVLGQLYAYSGDTKLAREWFDVARQLAGAMQSRGLFSATIFNQFGLEMWRNVLIGRLDALASDALEAGDISFLDAATNYDNLTGVSHRPALNQLLNAQLLGAQGRYVEALRALDNIRNDDAGLGAMGEHRLDLERAWNNYHLARSDVDYEAVQTLLEAAFSNLIDDDELALAHLLMCRLSLARGNIRAQLIHRDAAAYYRKELSVKEETVRSMLQSVALPSPVSVGRVQDPR